MINFEAATPGAPAQTLIDDQVASRIHAKDSNLFNFSENAQIFARDTLYAAALYRIHRSV